jgi:hypothetical protein
MSCNEWEEGTIKLPSSEFARVRKALEYADRDRKQRVFARAQMFWCALSRSEHTAGERYRDRAFDFTQAIRPSGPRATFAYTRPDPDADIADDLAEALDRMAERVWQGEQLKAVKPRRLLASDMDYPTNRTTRFRAAGAVIDFDKDTSSVTWSVAENNHAVDRAREHWLGEALFSELAKVRWTRGTGGLIAGNDEYATENRSAGSGANRVNEGWGPAGAAHPEGCFRTQPYTDSTGKTVRCDDFPGRESFTKQMRTFTTTGGGSKHQRGGRPDGGQFVRARNAEPGFGLH